MKPAETLVHLVHAVDRLDWISVRDCFADTVAVDYSELSGEPAADTPADDLVSQWQAMLPGFIATQHLLGPVLVSDDSSVAQAHVRAWHYLPDADPWVVAGHYEAQLDRDARISGLTLRVYHVDGPDDAPQRAAARAASDPRT